MRNPEFGGDKEPDAYKQAERFKDALDRLELIRQAFFIERGAGVDVSEEEKNEMFRQFENQFTEHILQLVDTSELGWHPVPEYREHMENEAGADLFLYPEEHRVARGENSLRNGDMLDQSEILYGYIIRNNLISKTIDTAIDIYDEELAGSHQSGTLYPSKHELEEKPIDEEEIEMKGTESKVLADVLEYVVSRLGSIYADPRWHIVPDGNNHGEYKIEEI